jgi:hypothetical protein
MAGRIITAALTAGTIARDIGITMIAMIIIMMTATDARPASWQKIGRG